MKTKNYEIIIRTKGAKYTCSYHDIQKLTQEELELITGRNTGKNIIKKLLLIKNAEIGDDMTTEEQEWYEFARGSGLLFLNGVIDDLKQAEQENGKINISKDWKYKFEIRTREE